MDKGADGDVCRPRNAFTDRGRSPNEVALNRVMGLPEIDPLIKES